MARHPKSRIDRTPLPLQRQAVPIIVTMIASMLPILPIIATAPIMPPLGFMVLTCWRVLHRNMWPAWVALPLGLWDDIFSGQPLGSAMLLWTFAMLALDILDRKMVWRDFIQDWALANGLIAGVLLGGLIIANMTGGATATTLIIPQILIAACLFPMVSWVCGIVDKWRLGQ